MRNIFSTALLAGLLSFGVQHQSVHAQSEANNQAKGKIAEVAARKLKCGVTQGLLGFSAQDDAGKWAGFDVDYCRALAAALYDDPDHIEFIGLSAASRFAALESGEVDVLARVTTYTLTRDVKLGVNFIGINYYDGQGIMAPKSLNLTKVEDLDGASICANTGTTTETNVADYFGSRGINYKLVTFEKSADALAAYDSGRCDAYTTDTSALAAQRLKLKAPDDHQILKDVVLSKEPLAIAVKEGNSRFEDLARWVFNALIESEEYGITSENIAQMSTSDNPNAKRLVGENAPSLEVFGLEGANFVERIVRHVGNYGEIFERNLGENTALGLQRGLNALWTEGGLLYSPPLR